MKPEQEIAARHLGGSVLLDTNLLLLLMVGSYEPGLIGRFKRTAGFSTRDFEVLALTLRAFRTMVTTPHLLTEVSSLANSLPSHIKPSFYAHFAEKTEKYLEIWDAGSDLMKGVAFLQFGLADAAVHRLAPGTLVFTEDYRLSGFLKAEGREVLNLRDLVKVAKQRNG